MYLHKITIDREALRRDRKIYQDVYLLHKKIWELVSRNENQKRDFLYRVEYDAYQNIKHIYLLAPNQIASHNNLKIAVSPRYQPQIETGEYLYFKLRANPIIKRKENGKAKEYSLVMDAKHQFKKNGQNYQEQFSLDELIHDVGMKWLIRKGEQHGFSVKQFEVKTNNDCEYSIKLPGKKVFTLRTLDFEGKLKIVDADRFKKSLFNGIGSAKAFGCGMMMVKRI
ncbi:MAG: type I-E CRISPR-associated protein Cas6/Cse3/CasE [Desulfobacterales bacterium]|nr:type I-E CRISPR-associated protein Cas6/Cse3/CasE [Desulfobacterales bacterium]